MGYAARRDDAGPFPMAIAPGLDARRAALVALDAVLESDRPLDAAWREAKVDRLQDRDAGFARLLVLTTLRRLGSIDAVIDRFVARRPVGRNRLAVQIMRIAGAELMALDGVPHAAVDTAVRLAKHLPDTRRLSGMVNAVCRRMADEGCRMFDEIDADAVDTPAWLWERLKDAHGEETARAIATAHRHGAPLDIVPARVAADWAERLGGTLTPAGTVRRGGGAVASLEGYEEGAWWVQDAAATLPAYLLGDVRGRRILDLCAAPGGKAMQLAAMGAEVTALDISAPRMRRMRENLLRTRTGVKVVIADALDWQPDGLFDGILIDAPCSATGTIRRHPDLPHLKSGAMLASLTPLQDALMTRAWNWLAPGGAMVYATCSLLPEEGETRIASFLASHPDARLDPVEEGGGIGAEMISGGALRTLPCHWPDIGGLDGFFAARLVRA